MTSRAGMMTARRSLPPKSRRNVCAVSRAFGVVVGAAAAEMGQPVDAGAGQLRALVIESLLD